MHHSADAMIGGEVTCRGRVNEAARTSHTTTWQMIFFVIAALVMTAGCTVQVVGSPRPERQTKSINAAGQLSVTGQPKLVFRSVVNQPMPNDLPVATGQPRPTSANPQTTHPKLPEPVLPTTPEARARINEAKALRQSTDEAVQQQAAVMLDCGSRPDPLIGHDDPSLPLVTCDVRGEWKFMLGPRFLDGTQITRAEAASNPNGSGYIVKIAFNSAATEVWAKYTAAHVTMAVAMVLNGQVLSAPTIQGAITGGETEISGSFSREEAEQLADQLAGR